MSMDSNWTVGDCVVLDRTHSSLLCDVCTSVMMRPIVLECGHSFCESCTKRIKDGPAIGRKCPSCRRPIASSELSLNVALTVMLSALAVKCNNEGCSWMGKMGEHPNHSSRCDYKRVECRHSSQGCGVSLCKKDQDTHNSVCPFMPVKCVQCLVSVPCCHLDTHKKTSCSKRNVVCPYYRRESDRHGIRLSEADKHMIECHGKVRRCTVKGCLFYGTVDEMANHNNEQVESHAKLLRQAQHQLINMLMSKPLFLVRTKFTEELVDMWSFTWRITNATDALQASVRDGVPLTSDDIRRGEQTWRLLFFATTSELALQLVDTVLSVKAKITFVIQERNQDVRPASGCMLSKHEMVGIQLKDLETGSGILKITVGVKILEYKYR